jgi:shikimate kinase
VSESRPLVVLIGPPGAGKTRLGKRIARVLKVSFIDTDRRIVAKHGPIAEIFAQRGEEHFRKLERAEVAQALTERAVVSLGGGAVLNPDTQRELLAHRVVLVTVSPEAVEARIAGSARPLVAGGMDAWTKLVDARREIYERLASGTWDTSNRPIEAIATEIAEWVSGGATTKDAE